MVKIHVEAVGKVLNDLLAPVVRSRYENVEPEYEYMLGRGFIQTVSDLPRRVTRAAVRVLVVLPIFHAAQSGIPSPQKVRKRSASGQLQTTFAHPRNR